MSGWEAHFGASCLVLNNCSCKFTKALPYTTFALGTENWLVRFVTRSPPRSQFHELEYQQVSSNILWGFRCAHTFCTSCKDIICFSLLFENLVFLDMETKSFGDNWLHFCRTADPVSRLCFWPKKKSGTQNSDHSLVDLNIYYLCLQ